MNNRSRDCDLKVWILLLLHVLTALDRDRLCFAQPVLQAASSALFRAARARIAVESLNKWPPGRYFYAWHNETRIAMARAEAEATWHDTDGAGGALATSATPFLSSIRGSSAKFPDFALSEDGCNWDDRVVSVVQASRARSWHETHVMHSDDSISVEFFAIDACMENQYARQDVRIVVGDAYCKVSPEPWRKQKPDIELVKEAPGRRSFKVVVVINAVGLSILAEGVYYPATGTMHLVGCTREKHIPRLAREEVATVTEFQEDNLNLGRSVEDPVINITDFEAAEYQAWRVCPDGHRYRTKSTKVCDMSITLQYPPLNARWNWQRVLKFALRSTRAKDDPLYFDPVERSDIFLPYWFHRGNNEAVRMGSQRTVETRGRMLLLLLGLVCVALQIQHGRNNEEALPFVSLTMLGIQIANHVSQTSIFKDLQVAPYRRLRDFWGPDLMHRNVFRNPAFESRAAFDYYGTMAWHAQVPYHALAMTAIFVYVWIFHRVDDRRRIMQLRVRKRRPGATDPPRDVQVALATLTIVGVVGFLGFCSTFYTGLITGDVHYSYATSYSTYNEQFVSGKFYELSDDQWDFVNRVTGLVVSLFLVPQLLGNWRWEVQGRPLSMWFYMGLPFLQSLPHTFTIAKHFQLLPIFAFNDPYLDSLYGFYRNPSPWWPIGEVLSSALLVLAVHLQFATSFRPSRQHSTTPTPHDIQPCDML